MKNYKRNGLAAHVAKTLPQYGDFDNSLDYQSACNQLNAADAAFLSLPAKVRERMGNDPGKFLDFMANPENKEEAIRLGLLPPITPKKPKAPEPVEGNLPLPEGDEGTPPAVEG